MQTDFSKPSEKPEDRHARPALAAPGTHARLSNINENGRFVEDEVFMATHTPRVRKDKTSAGNLMKSWRKVRDEGDEEAKAFFQDGEKVRSEAEVERTPSSRTVSEGLLPGH